MGFDRKRTLGCRPDLLGDIVPEPLLCLAVLYRKKT